MATTGPPGWQGAPGLPGPTGVDGRIGLQGPRGNTGPAHGIQGPPFTVAQSIVPYIVITSSETVYLTPNNIGTHYNVTGYPVTVYLPGWYIPTYGTGPLIPITNIGWNGTGYPLYVETTTPHNFRTNSVVTIRGLTVGYPEWNITNTRVTRYNATNFTFPTTVVGGQVQESGITGATAQESTAVETQNEQFPDPYWEGGYWVFAQNASSLGVTFIIPERMSLMVAGTTYYNSYNWNIYGSLRIFYTSNGFIGLTKNIA